MAVDHMVEIIAIVLSLFPIFTYIYVFWSQYRCRNNNSTVYPMQILNLRSAALLPLFALCLTVSICVPATFQALVPVETVLEALAVAYFYGLMITNCGGPLKVIQILANNPDRAVCNCCVKPQTQTPVVCYKRVYTGVWQFVYFRPLVASIGAVIYYRTNLENVFLLIQGICFLQTVWMLIGLLTLAFTLYEDCYGLNIVYKLLVIKVSVGLVVIQGFVIDNLYTYGYLSVPHSYNYANYNDDDRLLRAYCLLCLAEFVLLCIPLWWGFGYQIVPSKYYVPPSATTHSYQHMHSTDHLMHDDDKAAFLSHTSSLNESVSSVSSGARARAECCSMILDVLNLCKFCWNPLVNLNSEEYKVPLLQMDDDDGETGAQGIVS